MWAAVQVLKAMFLSVQDYGNVFLTGTTVPTLTYKNSRMMLLDAA